ncbi:hypothetical protein HU759_018140 [Pseudomonas sp. OE 28.3]|uniref:hypothetical protein n=1 Tax=unclassified Pseudomonas TaxID=196821 RepID=UPI001179D4A0|nr:MULTISPECIES: hypothetical protein [unclassified Pseudomonas]QXI57026.1 hypothetical protein HU759_018140 [Pseudomonas sp. OE 28.3]
MRLSSMPLAFCAIFTCISLTAQAETPKERDLHCAAYYEVLSVAGDQPDISRSQSSRASYLLLVHAGYTPQAQEEVAQKMVELHKETPGRMTPASTAKLREKYDAECKVLLKAAL